MSYGKREKVRDRGLHRDIAMVLQKTVGAKRDGRFGGVGCSDGGIWDSMGEDYVHSVLDVIWMNRGDVQ